MPRTSQLTRRQRASKVLSGVEKRFPRGETYRFDGKSYSRDELAAVFRAQIDALNEIRAARAALAVAVSKERTAAQRVRALTPRVVAYVGERFGTTADVFADFGWELPKKPGPKTTAAKLAGVVRGKATRKARGTMGKKQRLRVKGSLSQT
jgi:hypothetical protein